MGFFCSCCVLRSWAQWNTFISSSQALDSLDWNAANCVYRLFYRTASASWINVTIRDCATTVWPLRRLTPNTLYEIAIRTENSEGPGPTSPTVFALSGQRPPLEPPAELNVLRVDSSSFEVGWEPLYVLPPRTVDGYWVWYKITSFSFWSKEICQCKDMQKLLNDSKLDVSELSNQKWTCKLIQFAVNCLVSHLIGMLIFTRLIFSLAYFIPL